MAKLCPRGKAAAKRKFKVYPSAYANMYASAVCSGKVTPGGKKNRKKAMGGGMMTDRPMYGNGDKVEKKVTKPGMKMERGSGKNRFKPTQAVKREEIRNNYRGGGICKKGKGRAYGKNS
jgi:hypothetical protein